jgi:DNA repair protein RecO (recombination protein O)
MATYKTKGIILKRTNLGEADRILTIYTLDYGKIKVIAKGVRKIKSKLAGNLELFCLDDLVIAEGKNLDIVCGAVTEKCFFDLRNDLKATHTAYYLADVVDKLSEEEEPHKEVFEFLDNLLEEINGGNAAILLPYFEIKFLKELGYKPELFFCVACKAKIKNGRNFFDFDEGGLVCEKCRKDQLAISEKTIKLLRIFLEHNISYIKKIKINQKMLKEIEKITSNFLKINSQKEFKSERFIRNCPTGEKSI